MPEPDQRCSRVKHGLSGPLLYTDQILELSAERIAGERGSERHRPLLEVSDGGVMML